MTKQEFHAFYMNAMNTDFQYRGRTFNLLALGWLPTYGNTRRAIGRCIFGRNGRTKKIEISRHYLNTPRQNWDTMKDTVLHEIAHAIDFEIRGDSAHDRTWQRIAVAVGANPTRATDEVEQPKGRYAMICENCGVTRQKYRKPTRSAACRYCCDKYAGGRYDERFRMAVKDNQTGKIIAQ